jgi:predicted transcriptional regulator
MFPSEMVILMAIVVAEGSSKKLLTRPMDVTGEYIGYLCNSLVRRGYLGRSSSTGYQLTSKGRQTLFEFIQKNKNRVNETVNMLHQLGIEDSQAIEKLEKKEIGVN